MAQVGEELALKFGADIGDIKSKLDELQSKLSSVGTKATETAASMDTAFNRVATSLTNLVAAAVTYETLKRLFEETTTKAIAFARELEKLAFNTGLDMHATNLLSNQMAVAGVSAELYTGSLFRMERQLVKNEERLNELGIKTRDASQHALDMNSIMQNALSVLEEYKAGYDRDAVALEVFGLRARDAAELVRLNAETLAIATDVKSRFGEVTKDNIDALNSESYAWNALGREWTILTTQLGAQMAPQLTELAHQLGEALPDAIGTAKTAFAFLAVGIGYLDFKMLEFGAYIDGVLKAAAIQWHEFVRKVYDYMTGEYTDAIRAGEDATAELEKNTKEHLHNMEGFWADYAAKVKAIMASIALASAGGGDALGKGDPGGGKQYKPEADTSGAGALQKKLQAEFALEQRNAIAIQDMKIASEKYADETALKISEDNLKAAFDQGRITKLQELEEERALAERMNQIQKDAVQKRIAALNDEVEAYRKKYGEASDIYKKFAEEANIQTQHMLAEIEKLSMDGAVAMAHLGNAIQTEIVKPWTDAMHTMEQTFQSTFAGLLNNTTTWAGAMRNILNSLGNIFAQMVTKMVRDWVIGQHLETTAALTKDAAIQASAATTNSAGLGDLFSKILSKIAAFAAEVFGGVFANLAPVIGPGAAVPAGASMGAVLAVMSMVGAAGGSKGFAAGTMNVPRDMFAQIHAGEMIIPSYFAEGLRDMLAGGGNLSDGGRSGGDLHVHIATMDARGVEQFFKQHGQRLLKGVAVGVRDGGYVLGRR